MPHFIVAYYAALYYLNIKKDWMDFSLFSMNKYEYMEIENLKKVLSILYYELLSLSKRTLYL